MSRLDDILRERYRTGVFGDACIIVSKQTLDSFPKKQKSFLDQIFHGNLELLTGIPVLLDNDLPFNEWKLANIHTQEIIETGTIET